LRDRSVGQILVAIRDERAAPKSSSAVCAPIPRSAVNIAIVRSSLLIATDSVLSNSNCGLEVGFAKRA